MEKVMEKFMEKVMEKVREKVIRKCVDMKNVKIMKKVTKNAPFH